jgi:hypothetical protein
MFSKIKMGMFLILLGAIIMTANSQTTFSLSSPSPSAQSNSISALSNVKSCNCNRYSSFCDFYCCCDSDCSAVTKSIWVANHQCINQDYLVVTIPNCKQARYKTIDDLQHGLKIYYHVLRALVCISQDNSSPSSLFIGLKSSSAVQQALNYANANTMAVPMNNPYYQNVYMVNSALNLPQKLAIPRQGLQGELCSNQGVIFGKSLPLQKCLRSETVITNFCATGTYADYTYYNGATLNNGAGGTIPLNVRNVYLKNQRSIGAYVNFTGTPPSPTANTSTANFTCSNVVTEIYLFVQFADTSPGVIISAMADLTITQMLTFNGALNNFLFQQQTQVTFFENPNEIGVSNLPGYLIGDPLVISTATTNGTFYAINPFVQPLRFNLVNSSGYCQSVGDWADNVDDMSTIDMGVNSMFSCSLLMNKTQLQNYCQNGGMYNLQMYQTIMTNLQYVAKLKNASLYNLPDWAAVSNKLNQSIGTGSSLTATWSPTTGSCSFTYLQINIFYSGFGKQDSVLYQINSVEVGQTTELWTFNNPNSSQPQMFYHDLMINFYNMNSDPVFWISPPPDATPYLPNDVLYPFMTSGFGSKLVLTTTTLLFTIIGVYLI